MQEAIRKQILEAIDALNKHVAERAVSHDEVELYLGLLKESRNFMSPEEVAQIMAARGRVMVN